MFNLLPVTYFIRVTKMFFCWIPHYSWRPAFACIHLSFNSVRMLLLLSMRVCYTFVQSSNTCDPFHRKFVVLQAMTTPVCWNTLLTPYPQFLSNVTMAQITLNRVWGSVRKISWMDRMTTSSYMQKSGVDLWSQSLKKQRTFPVSETRSEVPLNMSVNQWMHFSVKIYLKIMSGKPSSTSDN